MTSFDCGHLCLFRLGGGGGREGVLHNSFEGGSLVREGLKVNDTVTGILYTTLNLLHITHGLYAGDTELHFDTKQACRDIGYRL